MKPIDRLRAVGPVPRDRPLPCRPRPSVIIGPARVAGRHTSRRVWAAVVVPCAAVAVLALLAWPSDSAPNLPGAQEVSGSMTDSPYYSSFEELEARSAAVVEGTVTGARDTVYQGIDEVAFAVTVHASTGEQSGRIEVLITSPGDTEPTAESEPLRVGQRYVLALYGSSGDPWHLTAPAGQGAFPVTDGVAGKSLDGSLTVSDDTAESLGLTPLAAE